VGTEDGVAVGYTAIMPAENVFIVFQALNGQCQYLDHLVRVADLLGRHRLRSSSSHRLQVPAYRL